MSRFDNPPTPDVDDEKKVDEQNMNALSEEAKNLLNPTKVGQQEIAKEGLNDVETQQKAEAKKQEVEVKKQSLMSRLMSKLQGDPTKVGLKIIESNKYKKAEYEKLQATDPVRAEKYVKAFGKYIEYPKWDSVKQDYVEGGKVSHDMGGAGALGQYEA